MDSSRGIQAPSKKNVDDAIGAFSLSLRNDINVPLDSTQDLFHIAAIIAVGVEADISQYTKPSYAPFWNLLSAFLLCPRASNDIPTLASQMNPQTTPSSPAMMRALRVPASVNLAFFTNINGASLDNLSDFQKFIMILFHILLKALESTSTKKIHRPENTSWPTRMQDILPFGGKSALESLVLWSDVLDSQVPFGVLSRLMDIGRDLVCPYLAESTAFAPTLLRTSWQCCLSTISAINTDETSNTSRSKAMFTQEMGFVSRLLLTIFWCCTPIFLPLFRNQEVRLLQLCSLLIYIFTKHASRVTFEDIEGFIKMGCHVLYRQPTCCLPAYQHPLIKNMRVKVDKDPLSSAHGILHQAKSQAVCCARGCNATMASLGHDLRRCAQCQVVMYCSKQCQRAAWKDSEQPHKDFCANIVNLVKCGGGLDVSLETWSSNCLSQGINPEEAKKTAYHAFRWDKYEPLPPPDTLAGYEEYEDLVRSIVDAETLERDAIRSRDGSEEES